jgi:flagellar biosynthesis protein FlhF
MHVRRFYAPTVRDALAAAREGLGPDAFVLSNELVAAPGWRGLLGRRVVALTAATARPVSAERPVVSARRPATDEVALNGVVAKFIATGVDPQIAEAAARRLTPDELRTAAPHALRRALVSECSVLAPADASSSNDVPRIEVFIGPPGVGKTTTIAKIAAQERAAGLPPRGMIAADAFRVGAVDHLRGYAGIIGSPFRVARDARELEQALESSRQPVLVDTAGRSPRDGRFGDLLDTVRRHAGVRTHLVLPADLSGATVNRIFDRYDGVAIDRVVVTKLDETESAAPLFSALRQRALPVSYIGCGQRVPEDLVPATPDGLVAAMLGEMSLEGAPCH